MGTFIFIVIMSGLGYFILRMKNESKIEKFLIRQGNKKPTNQDIYEELNKRKRILREMQFVTIQDKKQNDFIDNELIAAVENNFGKSIKENKKSWKQLGDEYEEQIAEYYKSLGYEVIERGKTLGRKDGGIDLIAKKESQTILIQCKNRNTRIKQTNIKQFLFDTDKFIEENKIIEEIELLYVIANDVLDNGAKWLLKNERKNLNYKVIPYLDI